LPLETDSLGGAFPSEINLHDEPQDATPAILKIPERSPRTVNDVPVTADSEITHEPDAHRYVMRRNGELVSVLEYRDQGTGTVMHHTVTVPKFRGHGYAGELVEFAVDDVEARGAGPIIPTCWYVGDWFAAHPERRALLAG
jgi:predicted GNAT family acetyltransferase